MVYATTTALSTVMIGVNFSASGMTALSSKAIEQAEAEVNKYLSGRYDLSSSYFQTYTSVPPMVRAITERMAEGYMWQWLARGGKEGLARGATLIKAATENLVDIRDMKAHLADTAGSILAESSTGSYRVQCNTTDYTPTFAEDDETAWAVDSDKLDDISNARD